MCAGHVGALREQVKPFPFLHSIPRIAVFFVPQAFCVATLVCSKPGGLRLQIATSNKVRGGRRYLPYAFTEHGAIMAATVLKSARAIQMSIFVVRAFVRMRDALAQNQQIMSKLADIEQRLQHHDADIGELVKAVRELMAPTRASRRRIGFELPSSVGRDRSRIAV